MQTGVLHEADEHVARWPRRALDAEAGVRTCGQRRECERGSHTSPSRANPLKDIAICAAAPNQTAVRDLAGRLAPELCCIPCPPCEGGARNAGLWPARGPVCIRQTKAHEQVTTEQPKVSGVPRAVFSKACSARPPVWLPFLATAIGRPAAVLSACGMRRTAGRHGALGRRAYVAGTARLGPAVAGVTSLRLPRPPPSAPAS